MQILKDFLWKHCLFGLEQHTDFNFHIDLKSVFTKGGRRAISIVSYMETCRKWKLETAKKIFSFPLNPRGCFQYTYQSVALDSQRLLTENGLLSGYMSGGVTRFRATWGTHFEHTLRRKVRESRSVESALCQAWLDSSHQAFMFRIHRNSVIGQGFLPF